MGVYDAFLLQALEQAVDARYGESQLCTDFGGGHGTVLQAGADAPAVLGGELVHAIHADHFRAVARYW